MGTGTFKSFAELVRLNLYQRETQLMTLEINPQLERLKDLTERVTVLRGHL